MTKTTTLALAALLLASAPRAGADGAAEDLAVVRKAVARPGQAEAAPRTEATPRDEAVPEPLPSRRGHDPKWFRVRVVEKGEKGARVKVNLPLGLVRALGDDLPIPVCEGRGGRKGLTVGDVLRALDSGESLVEIDDEEASVRIWVE